ncbi:hypothetical protein HMPREF1870_00582 [Bacteroidales bacterium KA00344]|nr:hypothetical protein HMPREF1870_00582 [Bacteroidales bacterium KA00344]
MPAFIRHAAAPEKHPTAIRSRAELPHWQNRKTLQKNVRLAQNP